MANIALENVLSVHHWNDKLFSFRTTRDQALRFRNGEFVMVGLPGEKKPILRAYSIASPNYEEHLEFFSIKVPNGKLTSRLQHIQPGDEIYVSRKPTGTLVADDLKPGKHLYLLATGTGLAPFMSIIFDLDIYDKFEKIVVFHGVRKVSDLAYRELLEEQLKDNPYIGELVRDKLIYYPSVTQEPFVNQGRVTDLIRSGKLAADIGLPPINPETDRAMLCGSPAMLEETQEVLNELGFNISAHMGVQGDYVIERAFVES
ncbi:ferredoxin--NADP reductase [Aliikangiella coralliicola]|uniref:ferredoxin--NADP(+) reductase n=1 Tax=Aliikangiella coralliicola TaxID=2592383 RepID=A0A545UF90_9GAMM|nr:ferredoxin--NADP reductase [Aliikangiella coralliicola]TQV88140.1 ferredoxin--NADP reductase [Aliikangiella coralliicola]